MTARNANREAWMRATIVLACLLVADAAAAQRVWDPPVTISTADQPSVQPELAMDGGGNAVATWIRQQSAGPVSRATQGARMAATGFWARAQDLYTPPASAAAPFEGSSVALNAAGRGAAVWIHVPDSTPAGQMVQAAVFTGTGWGRAVNLMPAAGIGVRSAQVGVDAAGNALAVWVQALGGDMVVRGSRLVSGTWSAPLTVSPPGETVVDDVALAVDAAGNAIAIWVSLPGGVPTIREARFTANSGAWSPGTSIGPAGRAPYAVRLAFNHAGTAAFVAFRGFDGANDIVRAARLDSIGGVWSAPADVSLAGQHAFDFDIAVDELGRAVAVWSRFDGTRRTIQTAHHAGAWSTPSNRTADIDTAEARIDTDAAGNAVAVWTAVDGSSHRVQASSFAVAAGLWSPAVSVSTTDGDAAAPRVRLHADGAAVAIWQSEGDVVSIQSSRYVLESAPILHAPTVTGNTVTVTWSPGVGPAPNGYTLVAAQAPGAAPLASIPAGNQTSLTVTAQDGAYYVRVLAAVGGDQVSSNEVEVIVGAGAAPTAPQALVVEVTGSTFTMTWTPPANVPPVTVFTYYIEAGTMERSSNLAFFPTGNTETTYVTPPVPNGSYWVRVRAQSAGGLSPASADVRVVIGPPPPDAPVLSGGATGPGTVLLQWTAATAPGAPVTGYQLRAGTQPGRSDVAVFDFPASTFSFGAGGVPAGTYYVRVVALSSQGPSPASNEVVVTATTSASRHDR